MDPSLPNDAIARGVDGVLTALGGAALPLWLAGVLVLIGSVAWTVGREQVTGEAPSPVRYLGLALLLVAWARWPAVALSASSNPDESVWIAASGLLAARPVPWLAVDPTTGGGLVPVPLTLASFLVGDAAWGTARAVAVLLWLVTLILLYAALKMRFGGRIARLALLPLVVSVAAFRDEFEFLSFNSEHVGNVVIAAGLALDAWLVRATRDPTSPSRPGIRAFSLGAVLGLAPWVKLQVAPVAATLGLWRLGATLRSRRWKQAGILAVSALVPTVLFVGFLAAAGAFEDFWISYVRQNLHYAGAGFEGMFGVEVKPFREVLLVYPLQLILRLGLVPVTMAVVTLGALVGVRLLRRRATPGPGLLLGLLLTGVAAWVTMQTREVFGHYLLFLLPPMTFLIGSLLRTVDGPQTADVPATIGRAEGREGGEGTAGGVSIRHGMSLEFLVFLFVLPAVVLIGRPNPAFDEELRARTPASFAPAAVAEIERWTDPGDRVAIWGWPAALLIESRTLSGTRDVHTERQLLEGPYQQYFAERYVADLDAYRPALFVDALPPGVDPNLMRFREVDVVRRAIEADYVPLGSFDGIRLYARGDLVGSGAGAPTGAVR